MYGHSERSGNNLRYKIYRASGGVIPGEKLFPVELPMCSMQRSFWEQPHHAKPTWTWLANRWKWYWYRFELMFSCARWNPISPIMWLHKKMRSGFMFLRRYWFTMHRCLSQPRVWQHAWWCAKQRVRRWGRRWWWLKQGSSFFVTCFSLIVFQRNVYIKQSPYG